jgi:hypothetical protein
MIACRCVDFIGVLISYAKNKHTHIKVKYAWAERAKSAGYPERFAQLALGHNSKAVHRAYAKNSQVTVPPLEEYERRQANEDLKF